MTAAVVGPLDKAGICSRLLEPGDMAAVYALHVVVIESLADRGFMYRHDQDHFRWMLGGGGHMVGAFTMGELVAYSAFLPPGQEGIGLARELSQLGIAPGDVAEAAGVAVHPEHRRRGIFKRLLLERCDAARLRGASIMASVVALRNVTSLRGMLEMNCIVAANHQDADGDNFLLIKSLRNEMRLPLAGGTFVPLDGASEHLRYLRAGRHVGMPATIDGRAGVTYVERDRWIR